jgi:hypothetical protein
MISIAKKVSWLLKEFCYVLVESPYGIVKNTKNTLNNRYLMEYVLLGH